LIAAPALRHQVFECEPLECAQVAVLLQFDLAFFILLAENAAAGGYTAEIRLA
jgi:hypothetical protein